jgi:hypothetical protein
MEVEVQGYLTEFGILRGQLRNTVKGINDELANWRPLPEETNSIYAIMTHLMDADRFWVRQVIGGEVLYRDREVAFRASGRFSELASQWEKAGVEMDSLLGKLSLAQLGETRTVSARPEVGTINVRWCILHLISHQALHLGHIQLTCQLWEQRPACLRRSRENNINSH